MKGFPSTRVVWTLRILSVTALGISAYLAWVAFHSTGVAGCGGSVFNCDHVLSSRWSRWIQVPVGAAAAVLYLGILFALGYCRSTASDRIQRVAWRGLTVCGLTAGLAAVWFIALQFFVIGHLCSYCLAAHACGLAIAGTILWKRPLGGRSTAAMSCVSFAGVLGLIGGQLLSPEPPKWEAEYHVVESSSEPGVRSAQSTATEDASVFAAPEFEAEDVFEAPSFDDDLDSDDETVRLEDQ